MENKTIKPECSIKGNISEYDLCMIEKNRMYENENQVYIGYGVIHSMLGKLLETQAWRHFYKKIN